MPPWYLWAVWMFSSLLLQNWWALVELLRTASAYQVKYNCNTLFQNELLMLRLFRRQHIIDRLRGEHPYPLQPRIFLQPVLVHFNPKKLMIVHNFKSLNNYTKDTSWLCSRKEFIASQFLLHIIFKYSIYLYGIAWNGEFQNIFARIHNNLTSSIRIAMVSCVKTYFKDIFKNL